MKDGNTIPIKSTPSILSPSYIMRKISINKETIKQFDIDEENRRMVRNGKVKEILEGLNKNVHFNSPFVMNERNGKFYLIDGNHRYEAIKTKINLDKNFEISVWCAIYRDLSKDEERTIYKLWNIGVSQTATDFLKLYFKTIKYGDEMLRALPVTIYGNETNLGIKLLVGSHIMAKVQKKFHGGYGAGKEQTISDFAEIDKTDILVMKEFCDFMWEVFGPYNKETNKMFYGTTPLCVFYRIWYDNYRIRDVQRMKKAFARIFVKQAVAWKEICSSGSRNTL
jgi:hypothetical protein